MGFGKPLPQNYLILEGTIVFRSKKSFGDSESSGPRDAEYLGELEGFSGASDDSKSSREKSIRMAHLGPLPIYSTRLRKSKSPLESPENSPLMTRIQLKVKSTLILILGL